MHVHLQAFSRNSSVSTAYDRATDIRASRSSRGLPCGGHHIYHGCTVRHHGGVARGEMSMTFRYTSQYLLIQWPLHITMAPPRTHRRSRIGIPTYLLTRGNQPARPKQTAIFPSAVA